MFSRCPLVSPKRRSFFFVRFLVQRAIFPLSFYFFKNCIFLPFVRFYTKRLYLFSSFYSVKDYTFLLTLFAFQKNCMFSLSVPFRRRLYVSFLYSVSSKNYSVPFSFILSKGYPLLLSSREPKRFAVCIPPFLASARSVSRAKALYSAFQTLVGCAFPPFPRLSSDTRFFRFYAPRRPGRDPFASVSSLAYPLPLPALRAFFPAVFPFPAPVVSRLSVPAPIKNRAGA